VAVLRRTQSMGSPDSGVTSGCTRAGARAEDVESAADGTQTRGSTTESGSGSGRETDCLAPASPEGLPSGACPAPPHPGNQGSGKMPVQLASVQVVAAPSDTDSRAAQMHRSQAPPTSGPSSASLGALGCVGCELDEHALAASIQGLGPDKAIGCTARAPLAAGPDSTAGDSACSRRGPARSEGGASVVAGSAQNRVGFSGEVECGYDDREGAHGYDDREGAHGGVLGLEIVHSPAVHSMGFMIEQLNDMLQQDVSHAEAMVFNPKSLKFTFWNNEPKLNAWFPDRIDFWRAEGRAIAWRNLVVSQLNLMVGFAVWLMWSIIVVRIQIAHDADPTKFNFGFDQMGDQELYNSQLYLLPALAGLSGGTFRITNSFMILPVGGRVTITMTTVLLMLPCALSSWELSRDDPQLSTLAVAAMLSGIGGGAFASSMSNISYYFPGRTTGLALGLNGGIGNLGVSLTQIMIPLLITAVAAGSGSTAGAVWVGALFWIPFCVLLAFAAWLWLNDMPHHGNVSLMRRFGSYFIMEGAACAASAVASTIFFWSSSSSPGTQLGQVHG